MIRKITSEYVSIGHPDKIADLISDKILDEALKKDKNSRVAVETLVTTNLVILAGEVTTKSNINFNQIVIDTIKEIGYSDKTLGFEPNKIEIINKIKKQSEDIALGVSKKDMGAGDQGIVYGYATNETDEFLPLAFVYAKKLISYLREQMLTGNIKDIYPDAKSQVTVVYDGDSIFISDIVLSVHHSDKYNILELRKILLDKVIKKVIPSNLLKQSTNYFINYTGKFTIGGPHGDTGLTGRKIIVDTYGGFAHHGGGAFSGKDYTKLDRSGAYMARYVAKNLVASGVCDKCEIQISYAIGHSEPVSLYVNTFNTSLIEDEKISDYILKNISLKPKDICKKLNLNNSIYSKVSIQGHFFGDFTWEKLDLKNKFKHDLIK